MVKKQNIFQRILGVQPKQLQETNALENVKEVKVRVQSTPKGSSGTEIFAGVFDEEYLSTLTDTQRADEFDKMRRGDARVKMCLSAIKNSIRSASWKFQKSNELDDQDAADLHARFLDHVFFNDLNKSWRRILNEATSCIDFGHAIFEKSHKVVIDHPEFGSYNGLSELGWRSPRTIERWNLEKRTGKILSIEQHAFGDVGENVVMEGEFLSVISLDQEGDLWEGVSLLRPCYGAWRRKQMYLKLMAIGVEKNAIKTPLVTVPEGKENSEQFDAMIEAMEAYTSHESNYITLPQGWEINFPQGEFDPQKVLDAIKFENSEMTFAFLANFLELGMNTTGSYALSNDLSDFFLGGIEHIAETIAEMFTCIGKELIILNFGPQQAYPELTASGISDQAGAEFASMLKSLKDANMITPDDTLEEDLRERMGLPKMDLETQRQNAAPVSPIGSPATPDSPSLVDDPSPSDVQETEDALDQMEEGEGAAQLSEGVRVFTLAELVIDKSKFSKKEAKEKAKKQGFDPESLQETDKQFKFTKKKEAKEDLDKYKASSVFTLAEVAKKQIKTADQELKELIQKHIKMAGDGLVKDLTNQFKKLTPSQRETAMLEVRSKGSAQYLKEIREMMAVVAAKAISQAEKEVPVQGEVKLTEDLDSIKLGEFEKLPPSVKRSLRTKSSLMVASTLGDLEKVVLFQYGDVILSTDDVNKVEDALNQTVDKHNDGAAVRTAAANTAARVVNESRNAYFFDDDVLSEIDSFTFTNSDPKAPICKNLANRTFRKDDPDAKTFFPPLHHNCKSILVPNLIGGTKKKISAAGLRPTGTESQIEDIKKSATLINF